MLALLIIFLFIIFKRNSAIKQMCAFIIIQTATNLNKMWTNNSKLKKMFK